jgi:hypothetical protein
MTQSNWEAPNTDYAELLDIFGIDEEDRASFMMDAAASVFKVGTQLAACDEVSAPAPDTVIELPYLGKISLSELATEQP